MSCEHRCYVQMSYSGNDQTNAGKPLMKMCTNVWLTAITRQSLAKLPCNSIINYYILGTASFIIITTCIIMTVNIPLECI